MNQKPPIELKPGDCLLYNTPRDVVDFCIRLKTWSPAAHCECYIGDGQSVASRNGIGVGQYSLRLDGLIAVLRPLKYFDLSDCMAYFRRVRGQKYDFGGLMCFYLADRFKSPNRQFCSEFLTNFYRAGKFHAIQPEWSADKVAPGSFLMSPEFDWRWTARKLA
jgi:hypothetical protein